MNRILPLLLLILLANTGFSQTKKPVIKDTIKGAIIKVHLTNRSQQPLKHEEIILASKDAKKTYNLYTNNEGDASVKVEPGHNYIIKLKTIEDTTVYGNIDVPALEANESFPEPFSLNMTYEPAKHYVFHHLEFDNASAVLKAASYKELEQLVEYMQHKPEINIAINGHTDNVGKEQANKLLSQQRADAVKYFLISKGIAENRITTQGFGATQPIADNSTEEGRQKNRRTELRIL
ncbi:MAG: OmpA family protein [Bacteroidota bacterium]